MRLQARGRTILMSSTPVTVASRLAEWFQSRAADGFNVLAPTYLMEARKLISLVVPELQNRNCSKRV